MRGSDRQESETPTKEDKTRGYNITIHTSQKSGKHIVETPFFIEEWSDFAQKHGAEFRQIGKVNGQRINAPKAWVFSADTDKDEIIAAAEGVRLNRAGGKRFEKVIVK